MYINTKTKVFHTGKIILLFLFLIASAPAINAQSKKVRIGVFEATPLVFVQNGNPEGLFIDLIKLIAAEKKWQIEWVRDSWPNLLASLKNGSIDILPALGYTVARDEVYDFNALDVYIDSGVIYTRKDTHLRTVFDLKGKKVAGLKGSIFTDGFIQYMESFRLDCELVYTKDNIEVMKAIVNGDVAAGVCIYSLGHSLEQQYPVTITPISFSPIALHYAVPEGRRQELIAGIDDVLGRMIADQSSPFYKIYGRWTSPDNLKSILTWTLRGIVALSAIGLYFVFSSLLLRHRIKEKTLHLAEEIKERKNTEVLLARSLEEKETLIRELQHRIKNTLLTFKSLMMLKAGEFPDNVGLREYVKSMDNKMSAIILVHQMLYKRGDLSTIRIREYVESLIRLISSGYLNERQSVRIEHEIEDIDMLIDYATSLGLILNELLTNSMKYAFPDNRSGTVTIRFSRMDEEHLRLEYSDDGVGINVEGDAEKHPTLGLRLIHDIAEKQLDGLIELSSEDGVRCVIVFADTLYKKRV